MECDEQEGRYGNGSHHWSLIGKSEQPTPTGAIRNWNGGAETLYGWQHNEVTGLNAHEILATKFPVPEDSIARSFQSDSDWEGELVQRGSDGRVIIVASRQALKKVVNLYSRSIAISRRNGL
jgi:hypothetical protein